MWPISSESYYPSISVERLRKTNRKPQTGQPNARPSIVSDTSRTRPKMTAERNLSNHRNVRNHGNYGNEGKHSTGMFVTFVSTVTMVTKVNTAVREMFVTLVTTTTEGTMLLN